ncbi:MAG: DNRLRE domain-containing protein, partial [Candidatus Poseidoniaceae archaeon]
MTSASAPRRTPLVLTLVMLFLIADVGVPMMSNHAVLEEAPSVARATAQLSPVQDVGILSTDTGSSEGADTADIGDLGASGEGRLLLEFNLGLTSSSTVESATLDLECASVAPMPGDTAFHAARVLSDWNASDATWAMSTALDSWALAGVDSVDTDRGVWEPPLHASTNGTFSLNVTALAQEAAADSSNLSLVIAATGDAFECQLSEAVATVARPLLTVVSTSTAATSGGTITPDMPTNGTALVNHAPILQADTTPSFEWMDTTQSSSNVQVQFGLSDSWLVAAGQDRELNSIADAGAFTMTSTSGAVELPTGVAFDNGTEVHWRARGLDSNGVYGAWEQGHLVLPDIDVIVNADGTSTVNLVDLGLSSAFFEDASVSEVSKNAAFGASQTFEATMTSSKETFSHLRMRMEHVGMDATYAITEASLDLSASSVSGTPLISVHPTNAPAWDEDAITWNRATSSQTWSDGGRTTAGAATDAVEMSSTDSSLSLNITTAMQAHLQGSADESAAFLLTSRGLNEAYTAGDAAVFHSSEAASSSDHPSLSITYRTTTATTGPAAPSLDAPSNGHAVWNLSGHNLSGNTTPDLLWTPLSGHDFLFELAEDAEFRERVLLADTRSSSDLSSTSSSYTPSGAGSLNTGTGYHWRMASISSDDRVGGWATSSFVVSDLTSDWLGGDRYELRLSHGNGTSDGRLPVCMDTYVDSSSPSDNYDADEEMLIAVDTSARQTILFGCDLTTHLLPAGYAVQSANVSMELSLAAGGSPIIGAFESRQHNWTESGATWATYDGTNAWGTSGARGWERGALLTSTTVDSSYSGGDRVNWNVTQAVQSAMRENRSVDFIFDMVTTPSTVSKYALLYGNGATSSDRAEMTIVYVPGSDSVPDEPVPSSPANGSWAVLPGLNPAGDTTPLLNWTYAGGLTIGGWALQLDTSAQFNTAGMRYLTSFNDQGFDATNLTYEPQQELNDGTTWYWRVRAISTTNQLGNWSETNHFLLPDTTTWDLGNNKVAVELRHEQAMPSLGIVGFEDTTVIRGSSGQTYDTSSTLRVGDTSTQQAATLLRIPLTDIPNPQNARVEGAELHMFSQLSSAVGVNVGILPALVDWNASANETTYDGTTNWTGVSSTFTPGWHYSDVDRVNQFGARVTTYATSVSAGWMTWDVADLVQAALASGDDELDVLLLVDSDASGQVLLSSTEATSNQRPWLNLTWVSGTGTAPSGSPTLLSPTDDEVAFDSSSHALVPEQRPVLSWNPVAAGGSTTGYQVRVYDAWSADTFLSGGWTTYDSREDAGFFMFSYTPQEDLGDIGSVVWEVREFVDGMYGPWSNARTVHIPEVMAGEIDADEAWYRMQYGSLVSGSVVMPTGVLDTTVDSGTVNTAYASSSSLNVGRSFFSSSTSQRASSLISFDFSTLPLPATMEVINASLEMTTIGTSPGSGVHVSVSGTTTLWNSSATWFGPGTGGTWAVPGGYHSSSDTTIPAVGQTTWVSAVDTAYSWNVTALVQQMLDQGDPLAFMLQAEDLGSGVGRQSFHSSDASSVEDRPVLNITYRTTSGWSPGSSTLTSPSSGSTLWNISAPRPSGAETVEVDWSSNVGNATAWEVCIASDDRFLTDLVCRDSSGSGVGTFDAASTTYNRTLQGLDTDQWHHWMVRAEQNHRLGAWSDSASFRYADDQGSDDGQGNHTITLSRNSVFTSAPGVPSVQDATVSSVTPTTNDGASSSLSLGQGAGGSGEDAILIDVDLSDLPWPTAMTPTQMLLRLYRTSVGPTSLTVAAYACSGFTESSVTWNSAPTCSTTEATRSTLTLTPPDGFVDFDLTSLAQSNIANGNLSMTVRLEVVGTPASTMTFVSSESTSNTSRHPQIHLEYVDNVDGILPPSQPTLSAPADGTVLYNTSGFQLESGDAPTLTWSALPDATDYILTLSGPAGVSTYRSWVDSEFLTNTSFRIDTTLFVGVAYEWWVQGVNQSIPGPSSSRWSFALGDPDNNAISDNRWEYLFQTGNEVADFGHTRVREGMITNASASTNFGSAAQAMLGTGVGCGGVNVVDACRMMVGVDFGQVPLSTTLRAHTADLSLYLPVNGWSGAGGASSVTLTVHEVLNPSAWGEASSTWNESSPGNAWAAPGLASGVDYGPALSTMTVPYGTSGWLDVPLTFTGMSISGDHVWLLIATPNTGVASFTVSTSEAEASIRPEVTLNYTEVYTMSVDTMMGATHTAGDSVSVFSGADDFSGAAMTLPAGISITVSDGTFSSTGNGVGTWVPVTAGTQTVTACYGAICDTHTITVVADVPTTLIVDPLTATITADDTLSINAQVTDDYGNPITGEVITYTPSNGTMTGSTFAPYTSGAQTIEVTWGTVSTTVNVEVLAGSPTAIVLSGCEGVVPAGTSCDVTHTVIDQYGNTMDAAFAGGLSWSTTNGNYSESTMAYTADHVGSWTLSVTSASGAEGSLTVEVGHGEMASLELVASTTSITADDVVYLNTTRIDVRGNRLPVVLPQSNWTRIADGSMLIGQPAVWSPTSRGAKVIEARYEAFTTSVTVSVSEGAMVHLTMVVDSADVNGMGFQLTADEMLTASVKAVDQKGNRWSVSVNWSLSHSTWTEQSALSHIDAPATTFRPVLASTDAYVLTANYVLDESTTYTASISMTVVHGDLYVLNLNAVTLEEGDAGDSLELTADDGVQFSVSASDAESNPIPTDGFTWVIENEAGTSTDIGDALRAAGLVWDATLVGNYSVSVTGLTDAGTPIVRNVDLVIRHGVAVALQAPEPGYVLTAGDHASISVTGFDADGNAFPQDVLWTEAGATAPDINATDEATYDYFARRAGDHSLTYAVNGVEGVWNVTVRAQATVDRFVLDLSSTTVEQLGRVTVTVSAFDAYDNPIPVPPSTRADLSDVAATVTAQGDGVWTVDTMNKDTQTITITVGSVTASADIMVEPTLSGFYAANSPVSYIGSALGAIVFVTLLVLVLRV